MNSAHTQKKIPNPRQKANIFSKLCFWYTKEIFIKGFRKNFEKSDLYEVLPDFDTKNIGDKIENEWGRQDQHNTKTLFLVLCKTCLKENIAVVIIAFLQTLIWVCRSLVISELIHCFTSTQIKSLNYDVYKYSAVLVTILFFDVLTRENYYFMVQTLSIKLRTAICTLIYRKILKLPGHKMRNVSYAKITNFITKDINAIDGFYSYSFVFLSGIFSLFSISYNMYQKMGTPSLIAIIVLIIFVPIQACISSKVTSLREKTSEKTDTRIAETQEALLGIRNIKLFAWEHIFECKLTSARKKEMEILLKMVIVLYLIVVSGSIVNNITYCLVLEAHIWLNKPLKAEIIYFLTDCFISFNFAIITGFPYGFFYISQIFAALRRIELFLRQLEISDNTEEITDNLNERDRKIEFDYVTIKTDSSSILQNVNLDITKGLTVLLGPASSGKSVLLHAIMKEFETDGKVEVVGNMSYASQESWLFPATIRQNIIFGNQFDKERYEKVITACALDYDLNLLENKDLTIVSDRGINLSKGQQARINLARAVYKDSDIYLIDDCFSCLDTLVARFVFFNCILDFLKNKIVLLVTHNEKLVAYADNILRLENQSVTFTQNRNKKLSNSADNINLYNSEENFEDENIDTQTNLLETTKPNIEVYKEENKVGNVSGQIYKSFVKLGGGLWFVLLILSLFVVSQISISCKDMLVSKWANLEDKNIKFNASSNETFNLDEERTVILYTFAGLIVAMSFTILFRACTLFVFVKRISINLHKKMLKSILYAPLKFFDSTFIGNIINRFTKDLITIDENIPFVLIHLSAIIFETFGSLFLISSTNAKLLIPVGLLFFCIIVTRCAYLRIGKPLKRLDASTKSPVLGYIKATLDGLLAIKAANVKSLVNEEFEKHHNIYNSATYLHINCLQASVLFVDSLTGIFIAIVVFQFAIFHQGVSSGDVGMAISQAFVMGNSFYYAFFKLADLETQMTAVERAIDYTQIKPELNSGIEIDDWPKTGEIQYRNVQLSINNGKSYILRNLNFTIKSREKIGIVGRTGAGKSSIISVLFRLYDFEGIITVDGVDIKTLSLDFLRTRIAIIPQDLMVFDSTLRCNLDPDEIHSDEVLWKVLEVINLKDLTLSLQTDIKELNLTCGQKQLLSLGRVLLKKSKILVLDEMVESVDYEIEKLITNLIDTEFEFCTVIKIAHKLQFILNCDKIIVMDNGEIIEYGTPKQLLKQENGTFSVMLKKSEISS